MTTTIMTYIFIFILCYVIGSIPTGYIAVKLLKKEDVREIGSGSTGATNVKRVLGTKWFFIVLLLDALKGYICVRFASDFGYFKAPGLASSIGAVGAVIGHWKSVFLHFTGGKSVATGVGTLICMCPIAGFIVAVVWALLTVVTKTVSMASIVALVIAPFLIERFGRYEMYFYYASFLAAFIVYTHRENIKRLIDGKENKI